MSYRSTPARACSEKGPRPQAALLASLVALSVLVATGCPAPAVTYEEACAEVVGCESPTVVVEGPPQILWRVLLSRSEAGDIRIDDVAEISVSSFVGAPEGPAGGTHGLAAMNAAGEILEAQHVRFPESGLSEGTTFSTAFSTAGEPASMVGYLTASATTTSIAVLDRDGTVLSSVPVPEAAPRITDEVGASRMPLVQAAAPGSACAHVVLLEGGEDRHLYNEAWIEDGEPYREPTPTQRAVVRAALGMMPPMLCAGVSRVAFATLRARDPDTGERLISERLGGRTSAEQYGDIIRINADFRIEEGGFDEDSLRDPRQRARLLHTIIHEAAHATHNLLDDPGDPAAAWIPTTRNLARSTIDHVRLRGGLTREWRRVHDSFVDIGFAQPYAPLDAARREAFRDVPPEQFVRQGVMSLYGSHFKRDDFFGATNRGADDLAEMVTWPITGPHYRMAGIPEGVVPNTNDYGCIAMNAHTEPHVPEALAAVYTKLSFAHDLGLIDDEAFRRCTGPDISLPTMADGFTVYQDGVFRRLFDRNESARLYQDGASYHFELIAEGAAEFDGVAYPAVARLELYVADALSPIEGLVLEEVPWPRGVYRLTPTALSAFTLSMAEAPAGDFTVTDGFVLVAEASNDRIVGSVVINEVLRTHAPLPVPQTFDTPLQFRFRMTHGD